MLTEVLELVLLVEILLDVDEVDIDDEVDVVVALALAGFIPNVLIVQVVKAATLSQAIVTVPAVGLGSSDCPWLPSAPVILPLWVCPDPTVIAVSGVATESTTHAPLETVTVSTEAEPPPAPVMDVPPF